MTQLSPTPVLSESIACISLPPFQPGNWEETLHAFGDVPIAQTGQSWRHELEPDFLPARVKTGRRGSKLFVFAELEDADIFTNATESGQNLWELGDTFEIFVRPCCQDEYYELHVAPNNCTLQMAFPSAKAFREMHRAGKPDLQTMRLPQPMMESWVRIDVETNRWQVLASIKGLHLPEDDREAPSHQVVVSYSRYDYTHERRKPVISSTSPHTITNFHRMQEWRPLAFIIE